MKARLGVNKTVYYFDATGTRTEASLLTGTILWAGQPVGTLAFTQVGLVPNLFYSSGLNLRLAGQYEVVLRYDGVVIQSDYLDVDAHPVTDAPIGLAVRAKLDPSVIGTDKTVQVRVVLGGAVGNAIAAPYQVAAYAYEAPVTFAAAGDYCLVWYRLINAVQTPFQVEQLYVAVPTGREVVQFVAGTVEGNGGTPHVGATVVVTNADGEQVGIGVTNHLGIVRIELPPGTHTASLVKAGVVYSVNNFEIHVDEGVTGAPAGTIHLTTGSLGVTVTPPQSGAPMCRLYANLYRMDGTPLRFATVRVALRHRPQLFTGVGVFDTDLAFTTDSNGYVSFDLVQGIEVEVSVAPLSLRRIVTVPSGAAAVDPVNLLTLLSQAGDLFDVIAPVLPAAAKRTL